MWSFAVDVITRSVASAFGWFQQILDAAPGAWDAIFTVFVIFVICRFLLGPLLGVSFIGPGSDTAKGLKNRAEFRRSSREKYNENFGKKGKFEGLK